MPKSFKKYYTIDSTFVSDSNDKFLRISSKEIMALENLSYNSCIKNLKAVQLYSIRNNEIMPVLDYLLAINPDIQYISIKYCNVGVLSNRIFRFKKLKHLSFESCNIDSLPDSFFGMDSIKTIFFEKCSSGQSSIILPASIKTLKNLEKLYFYETDILEISSDNVNLSNIKLLIIYFAKVSRILLRDLTNINNLQLYDITISDTIILDFSSSNNLFHLVLDIQLEQSEYEKVFQSFKKNSRVDTLVLNLYNSYIPSSISNISCIKYFWIEEAKIKDILLFNQINCLKFLSLDSCFIKNEELFNQLNSAIKVTGVSLKK